MVDACWPAGQIGGHHQRAGGGDGRHVVWGYCHRQGRYFTLPFDFIQVHFPGTGDVFSAVLVGELLAGTGLEQAARKAMDTVERLVCLDRNEVEKNKVSASSGFEGIGSLSSRGRKKGRKGICG